MSPVIADHIYVLDLAASRQMDQDAMDRYKIPGLLLMENAARGVAEIACSMMPPHGRVSIICGSGNNGGDGWATARHLFNAGHDVQVSSLAAPVPESDAAINAHIAHHMGISVTPLQDSPQCDLVIDALFGTGLDRNVEGKAADIISHINAASAPILSIDIPSGLNADKGNAMGIAVRATATATLAAWKKGFLTMDSVRYTGDIHTIDIGVPTTLINELGGPLAEPRRPGTSHEGDHPRCTSRS